MIFFSNGKEVGPRISIPVGHYPILSNSFPRNVNLERDSDSLNFPLSLALSNRRESTGAWRENPVCSELYHFVCKCVAAAVVGRFIEGMMNRRVGWMMMRRGERYPVSSLRVISRRSETLSLSISRILLFLGYLVVGNSKPNDTTICIGNFIFKCLILGKQ